MRARFEALQCPEETIEQQLRTKTKPGSRLGGEGKTMGRHEEQGTPAEIAPSISFLLRQEKLVNPPG